MSKSSDKRKLLVVLPPEADVHCKKVAADVGVPKSVVAKVILVQMLRHYDTKGVSKAFKEMLLAEDADRQARVESQRPKSQEVNPQVNPQVNPAVERDWNELSSVLQPDGPLPPKPVAPPIGVVAQMRANWIAKGGA